MHIGATIARKRTIGGRALGALAASMFLATGAAWMSAGPASAAAGLRPIPSTLEFGTVPLGASAEREVEFRNESGTSLTVEGVQAPSAPFTASHLPSEGTIVKGGEALSVTIAFESSTANSFHGEVAIVTEGGGRADVALSATAESRPELRVFPESLVLSATAGDSTDVPATFTNTGNVALEVESVQAPSPPFSVSGLPAQGTLLRRGEEVRVQVAFQSATAGTFHGSFGLTTEAGSTQVALTANASAPAAPVVPDSLFLATPASAAVAQGSGPPASVPESPPALTRLQLRASAATHGGHARKLTVTYTLSAPGKIHLAIDRRTISHRCPRRQRSCVRWLASKVKLDASGHAGRNSVALSLAKLAAGAYRLDATPRARSGAAGPTKRLAFRIG